MGENTPNNQDVFERHYNRFKDDVFPNGMRLADSERAMSDRVITQYLRNNFNGESGIPMDRIDLNVRGGVLNVEEVIIAANAQNWNPDYSEGFVSDTVKSISSYIFGEERKTQERVLSDQNARVFLNEETHGRSAVESVIAHTPSLAGFTLEDAKDIARADLSDSDNGTAVLTKFPDADKNTLRAVAYSFLHVSEDDVQDADLQGQDFAETARGYMHYAHEESKAYEDWELDHRIEIIDAITSNPEIMADIALIRAPGNIETAGDLHTQFRVRERLADAITEIAAKSYGVSDTLTDDDVTVVYKSGAGIMKGGELGYMSAPGTPGILNDETIIIRYNPAFFLIERPPQYAETDSEEVNFFLKTALEEIQHGIDHMQTDRLVLGTLPEGAPLEHHAIMSALSRVTYVSGDDYEAYSQQYIEKTAKEIADDVASEVVYRLENPEESRVEAVELSSENSDHGVDIPVLATDVSQPLKM